MDPANDVLPCTPDVDVGELVDLAAVQDSLGLGPNGGETQQTHAQQAWVRMQGPAAAAGRRMVAAAGAPCCCMSAT